MKLHNIHLTLHWENLWVYLGYKLQDQEKNLWWLNHSIENNSVCVVNIIASDIRMMVEKNQADWH